MKNTNKGFTLVELIVVITILAILGTIAFISLQGYSQDAKNTKVTEGANQIASKINIRISEKNGTTLGDLLESDATIATDNTVADGTNTFNSGVTLDANTYGIGKINFAALQENKNGFQYKDGDTTRDFIYAYAAKGRFAGYQVAGQIKDNAGNYTAVVKGSYYNAGGTNDVQGLIKDKNSTYSTGVLDNADLSNKGFFN